MQQRCSSMAISGNRMYTRLRLMDDSIEPVVIICTVIYRAYGTIWFNQWILTSNYTTITFFNLRFDVSSLRILNAIVEGVFWISLKEIKNFKNWTANHILSSVEVNFLCIPPVQHWRVRVWEPVLQPLHGHNLPIQPEKLERQQQWAWGRIQQCTWNKITNIINWLLRHPDNCWSMICVQLLSRVSSDVRLCINRDYVLIGVIHFLGHNHTRKTFFLKY